jgi:hypothetical protein
VGLAATGYELANQPGGESKAQIQKQEQAQAAQTALNQKEATLQQQGNAQEQTGGSLTDAGTTAFINTLAGTPGYNPQPGPGAVASSQPSADVSRSIPAIPSTLQELLEQFQNSSITGGGGGAPNPSTGSFELTRSPV